MPQVAPSPLLIPPEHLSVLSVTLPPTPPSRLQAALAGALEDQLLDDPADLHLAVAPDAAAAMKAGRAFEVMVCNKAWLQKQCDKLRLEGRAVLRILPAAPELQAAGWDLAQFDFRAQSAWSHRLQALIHAAWSGAEWRWARMAVLLTALVHLVGINIWAWHDRAELAAKQAQVGRILTQAFPATQVVVDAPAQMERAVAALRTSSGALLAKDLERLLAERGSQGASVKSLGKIDYANGELKVEVSP